MTGESQPKFFYGYAIVAAAFVIMLIAVGVFYSFGVFLRPLLVEFGWSRATTSGVFSLSLLSGGLLAIAAGRLNDRFGPRLVLTASGFLMGLGFLLVSQVHTIWQLYLFWGGIFGIGLGGVFVPLLSTVSRWFVIRRGMMTGIVGGGIGTGVTIVPLSADWLIRSYDWRVSAMVIGILLLVLVVSAAQILRRDPQSRGLLPDGKAESKSGNASLADGGLSFREAIRSRQFWMLWGIFLCLGFSAYTILTHIVIYATALDIPEASAASVLGVIGVVSIAGRFVLGSASDKIGGLAALTIGLIVMSIAIFWLLVVREVWLLYLFGAVFGFTYGGAFVLESPLVAELFGLKAHGVLYGLVDFGATIGGITGPVLAGYIFDTTGSYQLALLMCGIAGVMSLLLTWLLRATGAKAQESNL